MRITYLYLVKFFICVLSLPLNEDIKNMYDILRNKFKRKNKKIVVSEYRNAVFYKVK